jgi:hypothetical protein
LICRSLSRPPTIKMFRYLSIGSYCSVIYTQSSFTSSVQLKYSGFLRESTLHMLHRMNQTHRFDTTICFPFTFTTDFNFLHGFNCSCLMLLMLENKLYITRVYTVTRNDVIYGKIQIIHYQSCNTKQ